MSDNPQDREPKISRHGRAYASLLDVNLLLHVGEKTMFDLTVQDGRDAIKALRDLVGDDRQHGLEALARWLVSLDDPDPETAGFQERRSTTMSRIIVRAREALGEKGEG